jgi:hypothetical protein
MPGFTLHADGMQRAVGVGITERSTHPTHLVRNRLLVIERQT